MEGKGDSVFSFTSAMSLDQLGVSSIPQRYVLPPSQRPSPRDDVPNSATLPIIDLSTVRDQSLISRTINQIRIACKEIGCFQVINHGIDQIVMDEALEVASEFFNLPNEEKMRLFSEDVHKPVRYGTSLNQARDEVYCWRDFIKHYSHPISDWIHMWPSNPSNYREKMEKYVKAVQVLQNQLLEIIFESLGLNPTYLHEEISLEIKDKNNNWVPVPFVEGALVVQLGDQMEVMSNGQYKSVIHRATVNGDEKRFSIVSLHSFAMDRKMGPALELVDEQNPKSYKEFCFREFLDFISTNDITKDRFLDTLKMKKP
uniref:Protein SRG1 n=1 Tax=Cajanus cajan TaxID=3821 RepID=A0A151SR87_CAJCA|nr:Protein SRG1 [Cajanus cajan]